jgi:AraC family transcriptional regulator
MVELDTGVDGVRPAIVRIAPSDIARRQIATWTGIQAEAVELTRREPFEYGYRAPSHLLIMAERAERDEGETRIEGLPKSTQQELSHKLTLVPAGHRFCGWQKPRVLGRCSYFYLDPRSPLLDPELRFAEAELKPRMFFFDRDLWDTALKLKAQVESPAPGNRLYAEALGNVMAHELLRLEHGAVAPKQNIRGGLAGWQKRKLTEYIEEHLAEDISLPALAEIADLSPFHFARAFKQSFGLPPHRYLVSRRIEKAKNLLATPALPVTQIGLDLGFGEASSFATAFRKHAGLTPTEYRRSL